MFGKMQTKGRVFAIGLAAMFTVLALPASAQQNPADDPQADPQCWTYNMPQFTKSVNDHKASRPTGNQNPYSQKAMHGSSGCINGKTVSVPRGFDPRKAEQARILAEQKLIDARRKQGIQQFVNNRQAVKKPVIYVPNANPQGPKNLTPMLGQKSTWKNHSVGTVPNKNPSHFGKFK